jgi:hypothetical protein
MKAALKTIGWVLCIMVVGVVVEELVGWDMRFSTGYFVGSYIMWGIMQAKIDDIMSDINTLRDYLKKLKNGEQ